MNIFGRLHFIQRNAQLMLNFLIPCGSEIGGWISPDIDAPNSFFERLRVIEDEQTMQVPSRGYHVHALEIAASSCPFFSYHVFVMFQISRVFQP
jgi:hypothetical protein